VARRDAVVRVVLVVVGVGSLVSVTIGGVLSAGDVGSGVSGSTLVVGGGLVVWGAASGAGVSCAISGFAEKARTAAIAVEAKRICAFW
jgi:hypothetical protein